MHYASLLRVLKLTTMNRLVSAVLALTITLGLIIGFALRDTKKEPQGPFTFAPREAQVFHVQLADDILLEYKVKPDLEYDGSVRYTADLTVYVWDAEDERYYSAINRRAPEDIVNQLNQMPQRPLTHEIK